MHLTIWLWYKGWLRSAEPHGSKQELQYYSNRIPYVIPFIPHKWLELQSARAKIVYFLAVNHDCVFSPKYMIHIQI